MIQPVRNNESDALTGRIFDIARACVHDGPGLRTVVYMKGCRLDCPWCHNIEGKSFDQEFSVDEKQCIARTVNHRACTIDCPLKENNPGRITHEVYARIAGLCPSRAVRPAGRDFTAGMLLEEIMKDAVFLRQTNGGVTFSGGEPMAQHAFLFACADALKTRDFHLAMETSGFWNGNLLKDVEKMFDLILFDLKHPDPGKYKKFTGVDNKQVLGNLLQLLETNTRLELRITLVPGFNDSNDDLKAFADLIKTLKRMPPVRLLLFHRLAVSKQTLFRRAYPYAQTPVLPARRLSEAALFLQNEGIRVCR